jgi:hypothetical protein
MSLTCPVRLTHFNMRLAAEFLAPGVGKIGNLEMDSYPRVFRKDLVVHVRAHVQL